MKQLHLHFLFFFFFKLSEILNKVSRSPLDFAIRFPFQRIFRNLSHIFVKYFKIYSEIMKIIEENIRKKVNDGCPTS